MYVFTIPMAFMDYIPVVLFAFTGVLLLKDLYNKMYKGAYALFSAGLINVFFAGLLKATWKLLYAAGICDFQVLNTMFLPVQAIGFLLIGLGLIGTMCRKKAKQATLAVVPPVFSGSFLFIAMMVLGLGSLCACLGVLAAKLRRKAVIVILITAFICYMGMGYMSSHDSASAVVNWIEQSINCVGQGLLLWAVLVLHKAGLKELKL